MDRARIVKPLVTATIAGMVATTIAAPSVASAAKAGAGTARVIVLLRDQSGSGHVGAATFARRSAQLTAAQNAVLDRLADPAARRVVHFSLANGFAATMDRSQASALSADPAVAAVIPDAAVKLPATAAEADRTAAAYRSTGSKSMIRAAEEPSSFDVCPTNPANPLVEPEALSSIGALTSDGSPNAQQISTGSGVTVATIADGLDPNNPNFIRPDGGHVIAAYEDFSGSGTSTTQGGAQAFGDATSIAAQGTVTDDLSDFVNQSYPLPAGCNITLEGVAPDASIVALNAGDGSLTTSAILQSINYAVTTAHVNVIDESFAVSEFHDYASRQVINVFNNAAVAAGVTVTAAAGDGGPTGALNGAAQNPEVISAGASTDNQAAGQTGYDGARAFSNGQWEDDNISASSSGGPTPFGRTVDLVAPGDVDFSVCDPAFSGCSNLQAPSQLSTIQLFGGTGESAALTAGTAALVISAYRSSHDGHSPTPAVVKKILTGTATDLGVSPAQQGSGLLDARAATEAALTWPGATTIAPPTVTSNTVPSTDHLTLTGKAGSTVSGSVNVTNVGNKTLTVATATRRLATTTTALPDVTFDANSLPTLPYYANGSPWAYEQVAFTVPSGAAQLTMRAAWQGARTPAPDAAVQLSLLAPDGTFAAHSAPSASPTSPNYATASVNSPDPGSWTAILFSPAGPSGYDGTVHLAMDVSNAVPVGTITPATFSLAAGKSRQVSVHFALPKTATGDQDYAVTLANSDGHQTAVGVVTRTLIDTAHGGKFSGAVTGGDGEAAAPAETFSYPLAVPKATAGIYASLSFAASPSTPVDLELIDPKGEVSDLESNESVNSADQIVLGRRVQSFVGRPLAGTWVLRVLVHDPVTGAVLSQPFAGVVKLTGLPVTTGKLPDANSRKLKRHVSLTARLRVTNPGPLPIVVGVDPRTPKYATRQLTAQSGSTSVSLPATAPNGPSYLVPPDTTQLTVTSSSSVPAEVDVLGPGDSAEAAGATTSGTTLSIARASESGSGAYLARGLWSTDVEELGPFTDPEPGGTAHVTASIRTRTFDHTITTKYADPAQRAFQPSLSLRGKLLEIPSGQTRTIVVHLRPTAKRGTHVSGVINLVTVAGAVAGSSTVPLTSTGEVAAAVPYRYTVRPKTKPHHKHHKHKKHKHKKRHKG